MPTQCSIYQSRRLSTLVCRYLPLLNYSWNLSILKSWKAWRELFSNASSLFSLRRFAILFTTLNALWSKWTFSMKEAESFLPSYNACLVRVAETKEKKNKKEFADRKALLTVIYKMNNCVTKKYSTRRNVLSYFMFVLKAFAQHQKVIWENTFTLKLISKVHNLLLFIY